MKKQKKIIFEIMAIILIAVVCISIAPKTLQNDTFYTIKIGEHIIENGGIDRMDPFSWHKGLEYTYPHWLYDVMIYLIYSVGDMAGIYISTCVFAIILGLTLYKTNSKLVKNKPISLVVTIGTLYILRNYIAARAQLVTFILFALQIFFIEKLIETKKKRYGLLLILISILIANLHVAVWPFMFVLYLPYIAEYIIAIIKEKYQKAYNKESKESYKIRIEKNDGIKYLIIVMLICILTGLLTPLGPTTPYTYLIKTMQGNTTEYIEEHKPIVLKEYIDVLCVILIYLAILIFTDSKIRLRDLFMIGGLALLMIFSKRQLTMFAIIGTFILNRLTFEVLEKHIEDIENKIIKVCTSIIGIAVLVGIIIILTFNKIVPKSWEAYINTSNYPVGISDRILTYFEENNINIEDVRLYNGYDYGSYLLFKGIPVFIDSRCDLYTPEYNGGKDIFTDAIKSFKLNTWFEETLRKYNITHMLIPKYSRIDAVIQAGRLKGYTLLIEEGNFVFYEVNR